MKFLRGNMTERTILTEDLPEAYKGIGGRALTSLMINNDVPAGCDPLGPQNKLILAPGYFSGTTLVNTSRLSIGAKSPLTGGIKESNVGGTVAVDIARLGITAIIIEGKLPTAESAILVIDVTGQAKLMEAAPYKGMRTYALVKKLKAEHGDDYSVTCIGPAGVLKEVWFQLY